MLQDHTTGSPSSLESTDGLAHVLTPREYELAGQIAVKLVEHKSRAETGAILALPGRLRETPGTAMDEVPLAYGGRAAWVSREQRPVLDGHVDADALELPGVRGELGVRSTIAAPPDRGVLLDCASSPEHFIGHQLELRQFVAFWIGVVAHEQRMGGQDEWLR